MRPFQRLALVPLVHLVPVALLAAPAAAHTLSGVVVSSTGQPVANVDIDVQDQVSGNFLTLSGDFTNGAGAFAIDVPTGLYTVSFTPPGPPVTTHLSTQRSGVLVTGALNIGTIDLPPGVALSGRVLGPTGAPLVGLDLDVVDRVSGQNVDLQGDVTDTFGRFTMAVPLGPIELQIEPNQNMSPRIAPDHRELDLTANTDLGDLPLEVGYLVSAVVRRSGGQPVQGVDLDAIDTTTGLKRFTPGDNTDAQGAVAFIVPAGTYDIDFCAPLAARLTNLVLTGVPIAADTNIGSWTLAPGVVMSGTVRSQSGALLAGVDVDLFDRVTGAETPICRDDTDANGAYAIAVPAGTWDVVFTPSFADPFGTQRLPSVDVNGDRTLNGTLPNCGCLTPTGFGVAGTGGIVPQLSSTGGCLRLGNPDHALSLSGGRGGATALLIFSVAAPPPAGGIGGLLAAGPNRSFGPAVPLVLGGPAGVAGAGSAVHPYPLSSNPSLVGLELRAFAFVVDSQAPNGRARTRLLRGIFCD